jgi:hypothetical protein
MSGVEAMTVQLTLTLPDNVVQRAQWWAARTGRDVAEIVVRAANLSLPSLEGETAADLDALTDVQIMTLTHPQMDPTQDARLSVLLERQQAALLTPDERAELEELMLHYEIGLLRKAEALAEAVRRGPRKPSSY